MTDIDLIDTLKASMEMSKALTKRAYELDYQIAEHLIAQQQTINQLSSLLYKSHLNEREFRVKTSERLYKIEKRIS